MAIDVLLGKPDWHLGLDSNNDLSMISDAEQVGQNVAQRLKSFEGEYFLDREHGVPWFQRIFTAPANLPLSESILKREIIETEDVLQLLSFDASFDPVQRLATFTSFKILTKYGLIDRIIQD